MYTRCSTRQVERRERERVTSSVHPRNAWNILTKYRRRRLEMRGGEKASTVKCFHFLPFLSQVSSVGMCTYVQKIYNFSPWLMLVAQCEIWERTRPMLELLLLLLRHMLKSAIYNQVEGERRILITPFRGAPQARVKHYHTLSTPSSRLSPVLQ